MKDLSNHTILLTGAAGGIGLHLSSYFAEAGARLILTDINKAALDDAAKRLEKYKTGIATYVVDQADKKAVDAMAADILAKYGAPDILVNNAGIGHHAELADTDFETWHKLMNVNFWGALHYVYAFLPAMKQRNSGHIINVATGQVFYRVPTWGAYTVTKTALAAFSDILRAEAEKNNIRVTTVYPYMVNTGFYKDVEGETLGGQLMVALLPFYSQTPEDVARIIFEAVIDEKPVEMVSPLNYFGKYMRMVPLLSDLFDKVMVLGLSKEGSANLRDSSLVKSTAETINTLVKAIDNRTPNIGFRIDELMSGEHEFTPGHGPAGKRPFEFNVTWGTDNLIEWVNPSSENFMANTLEGTVTVDGLCRNAPCKGRLELRYLQDQKIRYVFDFTVDGKQYHFIGEKRQIFPWNLPWSHTTCFGELREAGKDEVISKSITHFHWDTLPDFLKSLRVVGV